ncbi:TetR/AcrR family transcriptional regulator [Halosolutus gelatinilyticus]|uniref:TetR/AcrR family transcriptional regulator n=1 Tax=Halosolutus gelatinilyticus TaxID=2931975 RepID=UPI001FF2E36B|nr:TetR/AcrR family transcriptional regulator [Halosolutus gelatinilyticus]
MTDTKPPSIPDETYEELIWATFVALSKNGYTNVRVRHIDDEFEKSRQLINHYFDGKDELITELLSFLIEYGDDHFDHDPDADPLTKLNHEIDLILLGSGMDEVDFWVFMTPIYEIMSQAHHNPDHQEQLDRLYTKFVERIRDIIQEGIDRGEFEEIDPVRTANFIDDLVTGAHVKKIFLGHDDAPAETRAMIDRIVIPQLVRSPEDRSPS